MSVVSSNILSSVLEVSPQIDSLLGLSWLLVFDRYRCRRREQIFDSRKRTLCASADASSSGCAFHHAEREVCRHGSRRDAQPRGVRHNPVQDVQRGGVERAGGHDSGRHHSDLAGRPRRGAERGLAGIAENGQDNGQLRHDVRCHWRAFRVHGGHGVVHPRKEGFLERGIGGAAAGSILGLRAGKLPVGLGAAAALAACAVIVDVGGQTVRTPTGREYLPYPRTNPDL